MVRRRSAACHSLTAWRGSWLVAGSRSSCPPSSSPSTSRAPRATAPRRAPARSPASHTRVPVPRSSRGLRCWLVANHLWRVPADRQSLVAGAGCRLWCSAAWTPSTAKPQAATSSTTNLTWRRTRLTYTRGGWEGRVLASAGCAVFCIFIFTYFHFTFTCRCSLEMPWPWSSEQTSFHGESRSLCAHARERKWKIPFLQRAPQIAASADRPLAICSNCSSTVV